MSVRPSGPDPGQAALRRPLGAGQDQRAGTDGNAAETDIGAEVERFPADPVGRAPRAEGAGEATAPGEREVEAATHFLEDRVVFVRFGRSGIRDQARPCPGEPVIRCPELHRFILRWEDRDPARPERNDMGIGLEVLAAGFEEPSRWDPLATIGGCEGEPLVPWQALE